MAEGNFGARDQINLQDSGGLRVSTDGDVIANAITAMTYNCLKKLSANDWQPLAVGR